MKVTVIAAMDRSHAIGFGGEIPWYIPEDLQHFKETVEGRVLICGRKTFETLPKKYHNKNTVVITRQKRLENCSIAHSLLEAIAIAKQLCEVENKPSEAFVVGGGQIYEKAVLLADELILSYVKGSYCGDVFFPKVQYSRWTAFNVQDFDEFKVIWWRRR